MLVYRYEHVETGEGPYRMDSAIVWDIGMAHSNVSHPNPYDSFGWPSRLNSDPGWLCGCASLGELNKWFEGWHDKLAHFRFVVVNYDVDSNDVIGPDEYGQVVFWPDKTTNAW